MTVIAKTGDLFTSEAKAIGHGVNVYGLMGAGIAKTVRESYPEVYWVYREQCEGEELETGRAYPVEANDGRWVFNLATQDKPGANAQLEWVASALEDAKTQLIELQIESIALPQIGSGIGGLEWDDVHQLIVETFEDSDIVVEIWTFSP